LVVEVVVGVVPNPVVMQLDSISTMAAKSVITVFFIMLIV